MKCSTRKKIYYTEKEAEEGLFQTKVIFPSNNAVAVYQCDDCGQWHVTSRGSMSRSLKEAMDNGKLAEAIKRYEMEQRYK